VNVYKAIKRDLAGMVLLWMLVAALMNFFTPYDSCDGEVHRCGLRTRTDALTGCQYLESSQGSLMPRLDRQGRPMCGVVR
jgi:hypothetical protein